MLNFIKMIKNLMVPEKKLDRKMLESIGNHPPNKKSKSLRLLRKLVSKK